MKKEARHIGYTTLSPRKLLFQEMSNSMKLIIGDGVKKKRKLKDYFSVMTKTTTLLIKNKETIKALF